MEAEIHVVSSATGALYDSLVALYPQVTFWYDQGGPAHKRNLVVDRTEGPYIVFLDDDLEVSPYALYELVTWGQEHPQCGMAFARIYSMTERRTFDDCGSWLTPSGFLWARAQNNQIDLGQYDAPSRCLGSKSATCLVRRSAFMEAGGFDAWYYILAEETDLAWRLWLLGWEVWYVPNARSWHAFNTPLKDKQEYYTLSRIHYLGVRNYLTLLSTNLGLLRALVIVPLHFCIWLGVTAGFALHRDFPRAKLLLLGMYDYLRAWPQWRMKRKRRQRTRRISDRELWPFIAHRPPPSYYWGRLWRYVTQGYHG